MTASLDYYFSMVSPWAYIGHDAFHDMVARHGVTVNYRPVALLEAFDRTNTPRLPDRHQTRKDYRMLELQRWREKRGLSFNLQPAHWPFPFETADRMVIAAAQAGHEPFGLHEERLQGRLGGAAQHGRGGGTRRRRRCGRAYPARPFWRPPKSEATAEAYRANTEDDARTCRRLRRAPTWFLNGEMFWGQDRIDLAGGRDRVRPGALRQDRVVREGDRRSSSACRRLADEREMDRGTVVFVPLHGPRMHRRLTTERECSELG